MVARYSLKKEKERKTLIETVKIFNEDIEIQHGIEKCALFIMKNGKRQTMDRTKLANQGISECLKRRKIAGTSGILESDTIKQVEMKEKARSEYHRRKRKVLETLCSRNHTKIPNTWAVL